jgi:hypothetical protein
VADDYDKSIYSCARTEHDFPPAAAARMTGEEEALDFATMVFSAKPSRIAGAIPQALWITESLAYGTGVNCRTSGMP